jgi:RNA polymerase II subunit A C-terminal domain phosphatase SSU72
MRIRFSFHKKRLHVICLDVEDTPQDALNGGALTLELCQEIDALPELNDDSVKKTVVAFEKRHQLELFYVGLSV